VILYSYIPYNILSAALSGSQYITWHFKIQRKLDMLKVIGCDNQDTYMHIPVRFNSLLRIKHKTLIIFQMGTRKRQRCWPKERFVSLGSQIIFGR
jgi:hypothetical protein